MSYLRSCGTDELSDTLAENTLTSERVSQIIRSDVFHFYDLEAGIIHNCCLRFELGKFVSPRGSASSTKIKLVRRNEFVVLP